MKNFITANIANNSSRAIRIEQLIKAQIHNSLDLGWSVNDIILIANFDYEYMGVSSHNVELNSSCLTGSKLFALKYVFENWLDDGELVWSHDLDAWQNHWFEEPKILDVGATYYSKPKFNGGSIFWKNTAKDILNEAIDIITSNSEAKEEPTLNGLFKNKYKDRVTVINNTFNVGCSGFVERYLRSEKPIRVAHFHPYNRIAWETHRLDRNGMGVKTVDFRLEKILRQYYPELNYYLTEEGVQAQRIKSKKNFDIIKKHT